VSRDHAPKRDHAPLSGLETEYGLYVPEVEPSGLIDASRALVQALTGPHVSGWDYRWEDPCRDQRGFRVTELARDPRDAQFDRPTTASTSDTHANRVLSNGARFYNDHGHPEYSTPECGSLADLLAHNRAGDALVLECAQRRHGDQVAVYKNNTDYSGASYGAHENYLVARDIPFERLCAVLVPFLVTRQLFAGAGKVGVEEEPSAAGQCPFQLSQRADFCTVELSVDTLTRRPIVNTRDEPHADPRRFRRLHVIVGDSNMSDYATALKIGTTQAVLDLCAREQAPLVELADPVAAIKSISRCQSWEWRVALKDGQQVSALEIQGMYLEAARALDDEGDADRRWVLREWEGTLAGLERDPMSLADRLDWVAKRKLLETFMDTEGLYWHCEVLQSLDLEYHNLNPEEGLARRLEAQGALRRMADAAAVETALTTPPPDTRAAVRGACVARWPEQVRSVCWSRVDFNGKDRVALNLDDLVGRRLKGLAEAIAAAATPAELKSAIGGLSDG
jgi:proteasome accessory factor A